MSIPAWVEPLCGWPFELGQDGPERYDCWGIVREGLLVGHGLTVPPYADLREEDADGRRSGAQAASPGAWETVDTAAVQPGDVLEFTWDNLHVGLVLDEQFMLHVRREGRTCVDRYRRAPWKHALRAAYRHEALRG